MKPIEILQALPEFAGAAPESLVASPAWAMPCDFGGRKCTMLADAPEPADALDIEMTLDGEPHILSIADSPAFPELHAVWSARADVPGALLLALAEKDCGTLFQTLENCARRRLGISGLAKGPRPDAKRINARLASGGETLCGFSVTASAMLCAALGQLRHIDISHPSVREIELEARIVLASLPLPAADVAALAPGDSVLLPEMEGADGVPPASAWIEAGGRFAVSAGGVTPARDDPMARIATAAAALLPLGEVLDCAESGGATLPKMLSAALAPETPLVLSQSGKALFAGRLSKTGLMPSFAVDGAIV